jgi:hypothetical protein
LLIKLENGAKQFSEAQVDREVFLTSQLPNGVSHKEALRQLNFDLDSTSSPEVLKNINFREGPTIPSTRPRPPAIQVQGDGPFNEVIPVSVEKRLCADWEGEEVIL